MSWPEAKINSLQDFQQILSSINQLDDWLSDWGFRGQCDTDWNLEPSLLRLLRSGNINSIDDALRIERSITFEFKSKAHLLDSFDSNSERRHDLYWYTVMQHYGCPTRLLDWSYSPYVALYFAVNSNFNRDGVVYVMSTFHLTEDIKGKPVSQILESPEERYIEVIIPSFHSKRSHYQQGFFTITPNPIENHGIMINDILSKKTQENKTPYFKVIIPAELKIKILAQLKYINIKAEILFPDLYGLGQYLKDSVQIRCSQAPKGGNKDLN